MSAVQDDQRLTPAQVEKVARAIELAWAPGECKYQVDGAPCCVLGQLAALEGVPVETLRMWDGLAHELGASGIDDILERFYTDNPLVAYPSGLLVKLQAEWDASRVDPEEARMYMREHVRDYV